MNNTEVTPMFFHRPSVTSTYDAAESIATSPPQSDLDDEQIRDMLASPLAPTGERSRCRPTTSLSLLKRKLCVKLITFPSKRGETCSSVLTQKNIESRSTFRQGRPFLRTSTQFQEQTKLSTGSLIRKMRRNKFLKNKEIIYSQKQNLKSCEARTYN